MTEGLEIARMGLRQKKGLGWEVERQVTVWACSAVARLVACTHFGLQNLHSLQLISKPHPAWLEVMRACKDLQKRYQTE